MQNKIDMSTSSEGRISDGITILWYFRVLNKSGIVYR